MAIAPNQVKKSDYGYKNLLKVSDLISTNDCYDNYVEEWRMMLAVYEGIKWIKYYGYIEQHERELDDTYARRLKELYSLGYSRSIIDIFHYYLFKKDPKRTLGSLKDNEFWQSFEKDANLFGDSFDEVIMDASLYASIEGHIGLLIDMPYLPDGLGNVAEQREANVYPYIARYFPNCILDWQWGHDAYGKPCLEYIKLVDDDNQYRIWTRDYWEIWELPEDDTIDVGLDREQRLINIDVSQEATFIASGPNTLGEIPFIWHYNTRTKLKGIGRSEITEIARIDLSIIRNLSQAEEIICYAAFPMLLQPSRSADPRAGAIDQSEDVVAPDVVLEFDPENPEAKPQWLKTEVSGPLGAIVSFISTKVSEIYRSSNTGGMASTEVSTVAKSGSALTSEFKLLNSRLVTKAILLEKTENKTMELWLKWMLLWDKYKGEVSTQRDRTFDVENLAQDLENAILAKTVVISKTFNKLVQQQAARQVLPSATEQDIINIDAEIEESVEKEAEALAKANAHEQDDVDDIEEIDEEIDNKTTEPGASTTIKRVKSPDASDKSGK
jgi:hypothetical protein